MLTRSLSPHNRCFWQGQGLLVLWQGASNAFINNKPIVWP